MVVDTSSVNMAIPTSVPLPFSLHAVELPAAAISLSGGGGSECRRWSLVMSGDGEERPGLAVQTHGLFTAASTTPITFINHRGLTSCVFLLVSLGPDRLLVPLHRQP